MTRPVDVIGAIRTARGNQPRRACQKYGAYGSYTCMTHGKPWPCEEITATSAWKWRFDYPSHDDGVSRT